MSTQIEDGSGSGKRSKVDANNRLHTATVARKERDAAINKEDAFLFGSTVIGLTNAVSTPLTYIKNTSDKDLIIESVFLSIGDSTGGTGSGYFTVWKNIDETSGIVTTATACPVTNMDIGSAEPFVGDAYIGATGETFTGGTGLHTTILQPSITNVIPIPVPFKIAKGQNLMFSAQAPTGNTSFELMLAITVYYLDNELAD